MQQQASQDARRTRLKVAVVSRIRTGLRFAGAAVLTLVCPLVHGGFRFCGVNSNLLWTCSGARG
ncbi:hypothetical protein IG631_03921 [Alternaria alternata]|nr:hypothetical protein IG631_03921 [Alternaria alternata]